jgi:2-iminobutanoate/2-iminopropanoate deaminase
MIRPLLALSAAVAALTTAPAALADEPRAALEYFKRPGSPAPFSAAVRVGDVLYLSGQIGASREDGTVPPDIESQTRLVMANMQDALTLAGASLDDVFKCTVMLADMSQWARFNAVYVKYFKPDRLPARSAFGASGLALGAGVELECMAYMPGKRP